jgi:hypothetical protein
MSMPSLLDVRLRLSPVIPSGATSRLGRDERPGAWTSSKGAASNWRIPRATPGTSASTPATPTDRPRGGIPSRFLRASTATLRATSLWSMWVRVERRCRGATFFAFITGEPHPSPALAPPRGSLDDQRVLLVRDADAPPHRAPAPPSRVLDDEGRTKGKAGADRPRTFIQSPNATHEQRLHLIPVRAVPSASTLTPAQSGIRSRNPPFTFKISAADVDEGDREEAVRAWGVRTNQVLRANAFRA